MLKVILATILADKIAKNEKVKKGVDAALKGAVKGAKVVAKKSKEVYENNKDSLDEVGKTVQEKATKVTEKVTEMAKKVQGEDEVAEEEIPPIPKNKDFDEVIEGTVEDEEQD